MKINPEALESTDEKMLFLVQEEWQGLSPATSYQDQATAVGRALDSVEYIERAITRGDVVLAHKPEAYPKQKKLSARQLLGSLRAERESQMLFFRAAARISLVENLARCVYQKLFLFCTMTRFITYSEFPTSFSTTASQYSATIMRGRAFTEAMLISTLCSAGLKCSFHCLLILILREGKGIT